MRVLVATDAWHPQVNGVVRTYERLAIEAGKLGFEIVFLTPSDFRTLPCPTYPEIRLALTLPHAVKARFAPLGTSARSATGRRGTSRPGPALEQHRHTEAPRTGHPGGASLACRLAASSAQGQAGWSCRRA